MFTGFSRETFDFLLGIRFNNNREWFMEHKQAYLDQVQKPLNELANEVWKTMTGKYEPDVHCHVAKIYKDARYSHPEGMYRDRLWFSLRKDCDDWTATPVFFFELEPGGYTFGMGYYSAPAQTMRSFRRRIDEKPEEFSKIAQELSNQGTFSLYGDFYKRSKGEKPEPIAQWYNRKNLGLIAERGVGEELFSDRIIEILCDGFRQLLPLYRFLWSLEGRPSPS